MRGLSHPLIAGHPASPGTTGNVINDGEQVGGTALVELEVRMKSAKLWCVWSVRTEAILGNVIKGC